MKLELKESLSPFWLIGLSNGKTTAGSFTNVPCHYKTAKKHYEIAAKIIKERGIDEVYLITGLVWDNMRGSWSTKEAGSYVQNKGKLILSKDEITDYDDKYGPAEFTEGDYPKGVSRDPLPKKGVKTYTSVATALEDKGDDKMKLELNTEHVIKEELTDLDNIPEDLQDRFFTTMGDGRPEMFKKFTKDELKLFADFVKQLPKEEITELERSLVLVAISLAHGDDLTVESIKESTQDLVDEYGIDVEALKAEGYDLVVFRCAYCAKDLEEYNPYIYDDGTEIPLEKIKVIEVENHDTECENSEDNMHADPQKYAPIQLWNYSKIDVVKESKIVTPVGNPQTAGSFVNIDVDLDHMEVSDFIVRLAQSIRSEQNSVLEYVALRSANGITNEDKTVIDGIIEEEKNHMVAMTTLLYKQLLTNHKQNVDGANNEFVLPKFGAELFGEDNKLEESVATTVNKLAEATGIRMSDEFFIGDRESGRMYHGLSQALDVVKNIISTSGEEVIIQNATLNDGLTENKKVMKESMSLEELVNELKTDTNYDEIAYHIHEYAKTDKDKALELMDLLFELEKNKNPKECRDEIIAKLSTDEAISVKHDGGTVSQEQWDVVVDVDYDADFQLQVVNNLTNAIQELNRETGKSSHYGIAEDKYTLAGNKFNFVILTFNGFEGAVDETFVSEVCDRLFERASNYEYYIKRA